MLSSNKKRNKKIDASENKTEKRYDVIKFDECGVLWTYCLKLECGLWLEVSENEQDGSNDIKITTVRSKPPIANPETGPLTSGEEILSLTKEEIRELIHKTYPNLKLLKPQ